MLDTRKRIEEARRLSQAANKRFTNEARELLSSFDQDSLWRSILAYIQLEERASIAEAEPNADFYVGIIRKAFLIMLDEGSLDDAIVAPITSLGVEALNEMRRQTGIGVENVPTPEPALNEAQQLDAQIIEDWAKLPSAKIRQKRDSSKSYAAALARLLETDKLSPHATVKVTF